MFEVLERILGNGNINKAKIKTQGGDQNALLQAPGSLT